MDGWRREGKRAAVMVDVLLGYSCAVEEKISLLGKRAPTDTLECTGASSSVCSPVMVSVGVS